MHNNKQIYFLYAAPAVIAYTIIYLLRGTPFIDDPYIFYRYAENWAAGYGPVFNVGEYVEGYSSFLWMAILAAGAFFSLNPEILSPLLNLFVGIASLFLMVYFCSLIQFSKPRLMAAALPLFCALSFGYSFYGAVGMDTIIFSLAILLCIISLHKSKNSGSYLSAVPFLFLLSIVRAEGPFYAVILLIAFTYFIFRENRSVPGQLFITILIFIVITILLFFTRYSFYKEWVPSTVLAKGYATYLIKKAVFNADIRTFKEFLRVIYSGLQYQAPLILLGAWLPFIVLLMRRNEKNILLWLMASVIAANIFVSLWAGGDWMPYQRFMIPVLPLLVIFMAWASDQLFSKFWSNAQVPGKTALSVIASLILLSWIVFFIKPNMMTKKYIEEGRSLHLREVGTVLSKIPVQTILLTDIDGKLPYYAGPRVYVRDIFGLTDIHNAKYGDSWGWEEDGGGVCGRSDFIYSFTAPFDIFAYNSLRIHKTFVTFCESNPSICQKYRFLKKDEWSESELYVVVNVNHPVSTALEERFGAVPLPVNNSLKVEPAS